LRESASKRVETRRTQALTHHTRGRGRAGAVRRGLELGQACVSQPQKGSKRGGRKR